MPPPETFERHDYAVWWAKTGQDRYNEPLRSAGVELLTRWENVRREVRQPDGTTITLDAVVVVDREIPVGGQMWKGRLADWDPPGTGSAGDATPLMYVATYTEIPDIKGRHIRRTVGLVRFRDSLPAEG